MGSSDAAVWCCALEGLRRHYFTLLLNLKVLNDYDQVGDDMHSDHDLVDHLFGL